MFMFSKNPIVGATVLYSVNYEAGALKMNQQQNDPNSQPQRKDYKLFNVETKIKTEWKDDWLEWKDDYEIGLGVITVASEAIKKEAAKDMPGILEEIQRLSTIDPTDPRITEKQQNDVKRANDLLDLFGQIGNWILYEPDHIEPKNSDRDAESEVPTFEGQKADAEEMIKKKEEYLLLPKIEAYFGPEDSSILKKFLEDQHQDLRAYSKFSEFMESELGKDWCDKITYIEQRDGVQFTRIEYMENFLREKILQVDDFGFLRDIDQVPERREALGKLKMEELQKIDCQNEIVQVELDCEVLEGYFVDIDERRQELKMEDSQSILKVWKSLQKYNKTCQLKEKFIDTISNALGKGKMLISKLKEEINKLKEEINKLKEEINKLKEDQKSEGLLLLDLQAKLGKKEQMLENPPTLLAWFRYLLANATVTEVEEILENLLKLETLTKKQRDSLSSLVEETKKRQWGDEIDEKLKLKQFKKDDKPDFEKIKEAIKEDKNMDPEERAHKMELLEKKESSDDDNFSDFDFDSDCSSADDN